jgi:hypothetical protein
MVARDKLLFSATRFGGGSYVAVDNWNENTTLVLDQVAAQNEQGLEELEK